MTGNASFIPLTKLSWMLSHPMLCPVQAAGSDAANKEVTQNDRTGGSRIELPGQALPDVGRMEADTDVPASPEAGKSEAGKTAAPETEPAAPSASMPQEQPVQVDLVSQCKVYTCVSGCSQSTLSSS